jgi:hypothetical protein
VTSDSERGGSRAAAQLLDQAGARPLVQRTTALAWSTGVQSGHGARNERVVVGHAKNVTLGCSLAKAAREVPPGLLPRIILMAPLSHASRARGDGQARRVFVPVARRADELKSGRTSALRRPWLRQGGGRGC